MSLIGKEVLPFTAQAYKNGEFVKVTEQILKVNGVLFVSIQQTSLLFVQLNLKTFKNNIQTLKELGVEVYSVSTDSHFTHKAWHDSSEAIGKITYTMIGDPSHVISRNFDVLIEEEGVADRGTFIIDPDGVIQAIEINAGGIGRDASTLINKIKAAQYVRNNPGEVCPAKWEEGGETLKPSLDLVGKI